MKILKALAAALVIGLITIACLEAMVRGYLGVRSAREGAGNIALAVLDPKARLEPGTVYALKRNYRQTWKSKEFSVEVSLDAQGIRGPGGLGLGDLELAFFGDSFTFGHGVRYEDMYTTVAAKAAGIERAASLSYLNGFQPEHYEFFFQEHAALRPRIVVVGLYLGNDLDADIEETVIARAPDGRIASLKIPSRRILDNGEIGVAIPACSRIAAVLCFGAGYLESFRFALNQLNKVQGVRERLFSTSVPNRPNTPETELGAGSPRVERAFASLKRLDALARERGGKLLVVLISQNYLHGQRSNPHLHGSLGARVDELTRTKPIVVLAQDRCAAAHLSCMDLLDALSIADFFPMDAHWNASGHRKAGEAIARKLREMKAP